MIATVRQCASPVDIFAAFEEQVVEVAPCAERVARRCEEVQAETPLEPARAPRAVLLGVAGTVVSEALQAENICSRSFVGIDEAITAIAKDRPLLAIVEHDPPHIDGIDLCRTIRRQASDEHQLILVMVAGQEDQDAGAAAGVSDWLIKPFTAAYARTKIRTWLLRAACKSTKSIIPAKKERRSAPLGVLHNANIESGRVKGSDWIKKQRVLQKGVDKRAPVLSSDKSALLWMYGREIASFDTPTFSKKLGDIIARATSMPQTSSRSR
jgi:CheY-like chemotaxis protein